MDDGPMTAVADHNNQPVLIVGAGIAGMAAGMHLAEAGLDVLLLDSAPAIVTLLGALRNPDWQVRRNAAAMLGMVRASWAVVPLVAALDDPNEIVRRTVETALESINTPEARVALDARRRAFRGLEDGH